MDCQMPVLDGYDATRLIRKDEDPVVRSVLIVAMTASAIQGDKEKCLEAGMNNYLAKPVKAATLKSMLEEYLTQSPKSMNDLKQTVIDVAKTALNGAKDEYLQNNEDKRPKFAQRMGSRNDIHVYTNDVREVVGKERHEVLGDPSLSHTANGSVTEDEEAPPIALADRTAANHVD
ncbi:MAG: hypothetical protein Q9164_007225 [Protoblastenia rupestris]